MCVSPCVYVYLCGCLCVWLGVLVWWLVCVCVCGCGRGACICVWVRVWFENAPKASPDITVVGVLAVGLHLWNTCHWWDCGTSGGRWWPQDYPWGPRHFSAHARPTPPAHNPILHLAVCERAWVYVCACMCVCGWVV